MSNVKFIGVGPEFGNECCICEGAGATLSETISLVSPATPGEEFCRPHGGGETSVRFVGCFGSALPDDCIKTGTQVIATCDGELTYFYITTIQDQSASPGCVTLTPVDQTDFAGTTCLTDCSNYKAICHDSACEPQCTRSVNLYEDQSTGGVCFPFTCCPCPETGSYTATASIVVEGGCSFSASIVMAHDDGIAICSGRKPTGPGNVACYVNSGLDPAIEPYSGVNLPYEKFGKLSGTLCAAEGGCSGTNIDLSLCCCETPNGAVKPGSSGECHTCNYQLKMEFLPISGTAGSDIDDFCYCPSGAYEEKMLPSNANNGPPYDGDFTFSNFQLVDGSCDPFYLEFVAENLWWNCDCCEAGDDDGDNDVTMTVTIT